MAVTNRSRLMAVLAGMLFGAFTQHAVAVDTVFVQQDTASTPGIPVPYDDFLPVIHVSVASNIIWVRIWHDELGAGDIPPIMITGIGAPVAAVSIRSRRRSASIMSAR